MPEFTPPEHIHALDVGRLLDPAITFFTARIDNRVVAVGALRYIAPGHVELKSMHTAAEARGQGVGRAMLTRLLAEAVARSADRASLETGTMEAFGPARALYESVGFEPCEPFGDYQATPSNTFMTMELHK